MKTSTIPDALTCTNLHGPTILTVSKNVTKTGSRVRYLHSITLCCICSLQTTLAGSCKLLQINARTQRPLHDWRFCGFLHISTAI